MNIQGAGIGVLAWGASGIWCASANAPVIVDPDGNVVAKASSEEDELIVHACDMDACNFGKSTIFDFARHRRIEHYTRVSTQTGVVRPD